MTELSHPSSSECAQLQAHALPQQLPGGSGRERALHWGGIAVPLSLCLTIWLVGPGAAVEVAWLNTMHGAIGIMVMAWTALRLATRPVTVTLPKLAAIIRIRLSLGLVLLYVLLVLQSILQLAERMLQGERVVVWGVTVPSVLAANERLARDVVRAHGLNAVLLLILIAVLVGMEVKQRADRSRTHRKAARHL